MSDMKTLRRVLLSCLSAVLLGGVACRAPEPTAPPVAALELPSADPEKGRLLIFVQPEVSESARRFQADTLPRMITVASEMGIAPTVVDARAGAPAEVTLTPQFVFQNHRGRSVYEGRSTTKDRLRNFLRTSRRAPLGDEPLVRRDVLVWRTGRAIVNAPLKIGDVTGSVPADHDPQAFQREARSALDRRLRHFRWADEVSLGRGDRAFYMDFYPYLGEDGTLYLSTALYSQFHCKEPVYRTPADEPFTGPWSDREALFAQAAEGLERQVLEQLERSATGDGFDPLPKTTPVVSWSELGLDLPARPEGVAADVPRGPLPRRWRLADADDDEPALLFHFPAPMDSYRGEARVASAALDLEGDGGGPTGHVLAPVTGVSMGDADLDRWIHGPAVLDAAEHPDSRFTLGALRFDGAPPGWGRLATATGHGTFSMQGAQIPLAARVQLEAVVGADERPRLLATGTFELPLGAPFDIEVPVGEPPANQQLVFDLVLTLEPDEDT